MNPSLIITTVNPNDAPKKVIQAQMTTIQKTKMIKKKKKKKKKKQMITRMMRMRRTKHMLATEKHLLQTKMSWTR